MSQTTLLDLVQDLLSASSGETVNSILDTVESEQIARIVGDCYRVLRVRLEIPEVYSVFELEASTDPTQPIRMKRPSLAQSIDWIKYDCRQDIGESANWRDLRFVPFEQFYQYSRDLDLSQDYNSSCQVPIANATVEIRYRNDEAPAYFTTYNTEDLLFNAYNSNLESTLQKSKTLAYGRLSQSFSLTDDWVLPFDEAGVALLTQEAKTQVFAEVRQTDNAHSAKKARLLMAEVEKPYRERPYPVPYTYGRRPKK